LKYTHLTSTYTIVSNTYELFRGATEMTTLQIELPDSTALAARAAGLLTPQALDRLLTQALRRREAADSLLSIAGRVAAADIAPMSMQEINAEVKATRAARGPRH
jgi:hypothetical protein